MLATALAFNQQILKPLTSQLSPKSTPVPVNKKSQVLKIIGRDGNPKALLTIELADTPDKRTKGLGFRQSLASESGMLFIHEEAKKYTYWMKGMQFPIDIIWIKGDTIADIIANIPPPIKGQTDDTLERYSSTVEVDRVLETNAGFVSSRNIQKDDKIIIESL